MPEGPQVFRFAEKLRETLKNAILESMVTYDHPEGEEAGPRQTIERRNDKLHARVTQVVTKGKRAVIILDDGKGILITFALTGKLEYEKPEVSLSTIGIMTFMSDEPGVKGPNGKEIHVTLKDPQMLASLHYDFSDIILNTMLATGFDPLHTVEGMREWFATCRNHMGQLVATFITNQNIVAGIGNRYRSEIMHVAKILPDARVRDLTQEQLQVLLISIYRVLKLASRGEYQFAVYGRKDSLPEGFPVMRAEVAKGILVWTTARSVTSARRVPKETRP